MQLERKRGNVDDIQLLSDPSIAVCLKDGDIFAVRLAKSGLALLPVTGIDARKKVQKLSVNRSPAHGDRLVLSTSTRKLLFFSIQHTADGRLNAKHFRALDVPDPPRSLLYNQETTAVGYRREYNLLKDIWGSDAADAAIPVEVPGAKPGPGMPIIAAVPALPASLLAHSAPSSTAAAAASSSADVGKDSLLLTTENHLGVLISSDGVPMGGIVEWPSAPTAIAYCFPFLVTLLQASNTLDIRSSLELGQSVLAKQLPGSFTAAFLSGSSSGPQDSAAAFVASDSQVLAIRLRPRSEQISFLLQKFPPLTQTAHAVLAGQSGSCSSEQLLNFHRVAGRLLFLWLQFDRAVPHLLAGDLPVHELLGMFPELRGKQRLDFSCTIFSPELTQAIAAGTITPSESVRYNASTSSAPSNGSPAMFRDIVASVFKARSRSHSQEEVLLKVSESFKFVRTILEHQRRKYGFPDGSSASQLADVALMRIFVMSDDADSLEVFLDTSTDVPIDEAAEVLEMYGLFECLAGLLLSRGLVFKALKLLEDVDSGTLKPSSPFKTGPLFVKALESENDLDLLGRFLPPLLSSDDPDRMQMGVSVLCSKSRVEPLPTADILRMLEEHVPKQSTQIAQQFLEFCAQQTNQGHADRLTQLALIYIRRLVESELYRRAPSTTKEAASAEAAIDSEISSHSEYKKLLNVLRRGDSYDAATVWSELQPTSLLSAKLAVAKVRGAHETAISICLHGLADWSRAVQYCKEVQAESGSDDAFVVLVADLFGECRADERGARRAFGLAVLRENAAVIDCRKVLRKLPAATSVAKVQEFLCTSLVSQSLEAADTELMRGLVAFSRLSSNCEMIKVHRQLQDRVVEVDQISTAE